MFVHELLGVYVKWAASKSLSGEILLSTEGHVVAKFAGPNVWDAFKHEGGKHCVQRVPPTESNGRRHTSMVSVAVLPIPEERTLKPLPENEIEVTCQTGHGPGGQHQNKTASAVRMVHKPTKLMVFINGKDQHANRREALKILTAKVRSQEHEKVSQAYNDQRKAQLGTGGRGDKIRTYNFIDSRAVDHRTGKKTGNLKGLMKGDLSLLV
jgi:peptide chain release factor 1